MPIPLAELDTAKYNQQIELTCSICGSSFYRIAKDVRASYNRGRVRFYCSNNCKWKSKKKIWVLPEPKMCAECGVEFFGQKFCSKSCSIIQSNRLRAKPKIVCPVCNLTPIKHTTTICRECLGADKMRKAQMRTLGEVKLAVKDFHSVVRDQARRVLKRTKPTIACQSCGYSKFAECAHLVPLASFEDATPLSVINSPENLVWLCPNCHWELDNGINSLPPPIQPATSYVKLSTQVDYSMRTAQRG